MSRRRGEFEHRTSIFEGAFRAWSHLGGLDPEDLETKPASELDPLSNPIINDPREGSESGKNSNNNNGENGGKDNTKNPDGTKRRMFPYEPLPRSGLAHPYVQAILSPWLGPDADHDAIQLGLTTLRTWWQHRRKGESGSAIAALGTDKMRGVVEGYTRHFFNLAHCLIANDKEQPPRTLHGKMKELEKIRCKRNKKRAREEQAGKLAALARSAGIGFSNANNNNNNIKADANGSSNLTPLEMLHQEQRRQLQFADTGGIHVKSDGNIMKRGKKNDAIPSSISAMNHQANQLANRGSSSSSPSSSGGKDYGDPNSTPVVFVSHNGDIQIAMSVEGITCAHCVKIVETVLKGCNGNKSPIDGLLDAAADRVLCKVLIKIDKSSSAKRVAFESTRNLAMVGYTAKAKSMSIVNAGANKKATMDLGALSTAFEVVANTDPRDVFDWNIGCTCPDNGILRDDCARHSQMNTRIFEAFDAREKKVSDYMAGCGSKYGMPCTCGPDCRCAGCSGECKTTKNGSAANAEEEDPNEPLNFEPVTYPTHPNNDSSGDFMNVGEPLPIMQEDRAWKETAVRNRPFLNFPGRQMSVTSETTFGRAMSGLSALSIDWENMEDFDLDVDHSAHINANLPGLIEPSRSNYRRSSFRRSFKDAQMASAAAAAAAAGDDNNNNNPASQTQQCCQTQQQHVSFKV